MNYNSVPLLRRVVGLVAALLSLLATGPGALAADSAIVIMYHRFGETAYPTTNIRIEQFEAHLAELQSSRYTVLPLPEILSTLRAGKPLPDRTVAITIDDAYRSVYTEAWPRLRATALPFTLFVATEPVADRLPGYMTWSQIRELRDFGVTIGGHTHSHLHMPAASLKTNRADIETSNRIFQQELGAKPDLFAYPYGEASDVIEKLVRESGYKAAFGQQSSPIAPVWSHYFLPRFPLSEAYGDLSRLRLILNAQPLSVSDFMPTNPLVAPDKNPPAFGFTANPSSSSLTNLTCYRSGRGKIPVERLGDRRIEIRFAQPFATGRTRLNCTMPGASGRWRWFGMQYYVKP